PTIQNSPLSLTDALPISNNVFAHSLWSDVYMMQGETFVDDKDFGKICDLGWKKCGGNEVLVPAIPVEEKWFTKYLSRTASVPGKDRKSTRLNSSHEWISY